MHEVWWRGARAVVNRLLPPPGDALTQTLRPPLKSAVPPPRYRGAG